jgi:hypothetical protein
MTFIQQGTHLKFKFNLPKLDEKLVRNIVVLKQKDNTNDDDDDDNNNNNEGNNSSDYSISSNEIDHSDEEHDEIIHFSDLSQESSLLGDRDHFND